MMKKVKPIAALSAVALVLAVATYAAVRLSETGQYKDKLWLHRCNSVEKYDENRALYPNVEVDVVWRGTDFDVTHDADTTFGLSLSRFLDHVLPPGGPGPGHGVWLDVKNLTPENAADCLGWLQRRFGRTPPPQ